MAWMVNNRQTKTRKDQRSFLRQKEKQKVNEGRSSSLTHDPVHAFTVPPVGRLGNSKHREPKLRLDQNQE